MNSLLSQPWHKIPAGTIGTLPAGFQKEQASALYYAALGKHEQLADKEQKLTRQMLSKGTLADRVSALVSLSETAPLFALPHVKRLLAMTK